MFFHFAIGFESFGAVQRENPGIVPAVQHTRRIEAGECTVGEVDVRVVYHLVYSILSGEPPALDIISKGGRPRS